jgi:hypothetical protein
MANLYFSCPKCGRTITQQWDTSKKLPVAFQISCFERAGVGCGEWAGLVRASRALRVRPVPKKQGKR